jgi:S-adenosylmethionine:tRNA ribosyltransferase-isomerase
MNKALTIEDYTYPLPPERIAAVPMVQRDGSRLLIYRNGTLKDSTFYHLPDCLPPDAFLVLNNTRVLEARLYFEKPTGGVIEILCLEPFEPESMETALQQGQTVQWRCFIGGASKWGHGQVLKKTITFGADAVVLEAIYLRKETDHFIIEFRWTGGHPFGSVLQAAGAVPLPPYIKRKAAAEDAERYQTVFADEKGSVAAPTAALHFTHDVLKKLEASGIGTGTVTLHVGAGTFKPVTAETIGGHQMHAERFSVTRTFLEQLLQAKTVVAVGTTSLRTLESLHWLGVKRLQHGSLKTLELDQWEAYDLAPANILFKESIRALLQHLDDTGQESLHGRTRLLIMPGYIYHSAAALVTNFHQPKSTLLLLVAAFIGEDWKKVYAHALQNDYRFLSYGDSSLLWRSPLSAEAARQEP